MFKIERSIYGFAIGIKKGNYRILSLIEGAVRNEENIDMIVNLLNQSTEGEA